MRARFLSETGVNDRMGNLVENDLPEVGLVTHCEKSGRDRNSPAGRHIRTESPAHTPGNPHRWQFKVRLVVGKRRPDQEIDLRRSRFLNTWLFEIEPELAGRLGL